MEINLCKCTVLNWADWKILSNLSILTFLGCPGINFRYDQQTGEEARKMWYFIKHGSGDLLLVSRSTQSSLQLTFILGFIPVLVLTFLNFSVYSSLRQLKERIAFRKKKKSKCKYLIISINLCLCNFPYVYISFHEFTYIFHKFP